MSFFGPISTPVLDESSTPLVRRALHRARVVGNFALVQAVVQIIGFMSGILIVRTLEQREYAYFTIANTMQGTINLLADIGISVGLVSIGGRIWQDRHRFGELINTALSLRKKLGALVVVAVTPIMYFMLVKNGASISYTALLIAVVLIGLGFQLSIGVLSVVPRLRADIGRIQVIDITGAVGRLLALAGLLLVFLNAGIAVAVASAVSLLQYAMLRNYAAGVIDLDAPENPEDRHSIVRLIKHLAANSVFYCFQGQITIFLISFFARRATSVAEIGALGRLAMIFSVLTNLLTNVFVPAFARCQNKGKMRWLYGAIIGGVAAFSLSIISLAWIFPDEFLFVLGSKYAHLHRELLLMVAGAVLSALTGTFWALNASKAWVRGAWLYIPLTLVTQIVLIPYTDFSSVAGVLIFNLLSAIPNLLLNAVMSYRGFRSLQPAFA
jgi:O-antigen/teichoic acid export membrane protein